MIRTLTARYSIPSKTYGRISKCRSWQQYTSRMNARTVANAKNYYTGRISSSWHSPLHREQIEQSRTKLESGVLDGNSCHLDRSIRIRSMMVTVYTRESLNHDLWRWLLLCPNLASLASKQSYVHLFRTTLVLKSQTKNCLNSICYTLTLCLNNKHCKLYKVPQSTH